MDDPKEPTQEQSESEPEPASNDEAPPENHIELGEMIKSLDNELLD